LPTSDVRSGPAAPTCLVEAPSLGPKKEETTVRRTSRINLLARRAWEDALCIFDEIEHPDREKVCAKLCSPAPAAAMAVR
jgi:hypothetical protein